MGSAAVFCCKRLYCPPGRTDPESPLSVGSRWYFEFSDENKIKYSFKTTVISIYERRIEFNFPEFIERSQRRKSFRINVPSTSLNYINNEDIFEFDTLNVGEGY